MEHINLCPFCESNRIIIIDHSFCSIKAFSAHCKKCLAHGPNAQDVETAISRWNAYEKLQYEKHKRLLEPKTHGNEKSLKAMGF